jgi:hypothetical protein
MSRFLPFDHHYRTEVNDFQLWTQIGLLFIRTVPLSRLLNVHFLCEVGISFAGGIADHSCKVNDNVGREYHP